MNFSPSEFLLFFFLVILSSNNNLLAGVQMPSRDTVVSQRKSSNDTKMIKGLENSKIQLDYRSSKPNNVHERPNLTIKTFHTNNQNSQRQTRTTKEIETKRINNGNTISKTQDKSNLEAANLETQNKLFEKKYFKILDELSRISKKLGEVEKRKELESKLQEYNQLEKIINQKQQRWLNLSTPTALKTDLTESFQEKMANWLGKAIVLKFQLQDITNQDESQDENRFWTFSNIKNKFKNELRKRNEKNLEKKVSSLIQSSQQELEKNRAYVDSMSLAAYTQNILGLIDRNTEFKDYDNIIGNLNETDCYFLSRELRGLIRSIKPSLEKVEDNNYHRNWTRARDYIMESVDNKVNECNQTLNSKSEKTSIDNYRNKLDSFLKDVNGFESKSDYELEVRIKELEDIYKNENSDMYKKSRFHERAELARTELSRRAESRRIEESKTRSNFTTLFNLGNYLMSKFK